MDVQGWYKDFNAEVEKEWTRKKLRENLDFLILGLKGLPQNKMPPLLVLIDDMMPRSGVIRPRN